MKRLLAAIAIFLGGCGYAPHVNPPVLHVTNAHEAAAAQAARIGGYAVRIDCCNSMLPLIENGDWVVTVYEPFTDDLLGMVGVYKPKWNNGNPVAHRFVSGNATDGFIASGDNNRTSEPKEPVKIDIYIGVIKNIYRQRRPE